MVTPKIAFGKQERACHKAYSTFSQEAKHLTFAQFQKEASTRHTWSWVDHQKASCSSRTSTRLYSPIGSKNELEFAAATSWAHSTKRFHTP